MKELNGIYTVQRIARTIGLITKPQFRTHLNKYWRGEELAIAKLMKHRHIITTDHRYLAVGYGSWLWRTDRNEFNKQYNAYGELSLAEVEKLMFTTEKYNTRRLCAKYIYDRS